MSRRDRSCAAAGTVEANALLHLIWNENQECPDHCLREQILPIGIGSIGIKPERLRAFRSDRVAELAASMKERGLLAPILLRPADRRSGYWLVSGRHRLEAARKLKWPSIIARVLEGLKADEAELVEIDENLIRIDLSPAERKLHYQRRKELYEKQHPETKRGAAGGAATKAKARGAKSQNESKPSAFVTDAARKTGKGRSTVARDLTHASKIGPEILADIVGTSLDRGDEIDALAKLPVKDQKALAKAAKRGKKVSAKTKLKQVSRAKRERELAVKQKALPEKRYGVIVADPEWDDQVWSRETGMGRHASNHYPTSDSKVIAARPVQAIAAKDCVLFLWTTNQHLRIAIGVLEAWGFEYKSNYVWGKTTISTGRWNRSKHEILLIGTCGEPPCPAPGQQWDSLIMAPKGKHSEKPECFMEMIEQYYPTMPRIELNCVGAPRRGWDGWGNEVKLEAAE